MTTDHGQGGGQASAGKGCGNLPVPSSGLGLKVVLKGGVCPRACVQDRVRFPVAGVDSREAATIPVNTVSANSVEREIP